MLSLNQTFSTICGNVYKLGIHQHRPIIQRMKSVQTMHFSHQSIQSINEASKSLQKLNERSLLVLDVDEVLITPKDNILQSSSKSIKPHPLDFINTLEEPQRKYYLSLIYTQTQMQIVEPDFIGWLERLKQKKVKVIALTAFETPTYGVIQDTVSARIHELKKLHVDFKFSFQKHSFLQLRQGFDQNYPVFKEGILFSAPHSKGKVLKAFLQKIKESFDRIIFIDDSLDNLDSVKKELNMNRVQCIHYLGASMLSGKACPKISAVQLHHLLKTNKWLSDNEAQDYLNKKMFDSPVPIMFQKNAPSLPIQRKAAMKSSENKVAAYLFDRKNYSIPTIITPYHWPDIDGIACTYALEKLLQLKGYKEVRGMISQIPQKEPLWIMEKFNFSYPQIQTTPKDQLYLVDVSDPKDLPESLPLQQIKIVIDHRSYTDLSLMPNALSWIEPMGSAATLIYQLYLNQGILPDPQSAQLLYAAIMSNTIKCRTRNTTNMDRQAVAKLKELGQPPIHLIDEMFEAKSNLNDISLQTHLDEDLSSKLQLIAGEPTAVAQLEMVGVEKLIKTRYDELKEALKALQGQRKAKRIFLIAIDLLEGKTFFIFLDPKMQQLLGSHFSLTERNGFSFSNETLTRKDVIFTLQSSRLL
jgi:inorganic pyrophosphatase/exopolyphosphatase